MDVFQLEQRLQKLEKASHALHLRSDKRTQMTAQVNEVIESFLEKRETMPAYTDTDDSVLAELDTVPQEGPGSLSDLLSLYCQAVAESGANTNIGRFFGFIPGSALYAGALGDYLGAATNPFAGVTYGSPGAVRMERSLTRWIANFIGYPDTALGDLTSGGSMATLSAVTTARHAWGIGVSQVEKAVVYLSPHTHYCLEKALKIIGMGECVRRQVKLTADYRMDPQALKQLIEADLAQGFMPWLVVATAGATDTGTVDPLDAIADVAHEYGLWFHVDGAYGASFALTTEGKSILKGLERSDSMVLDPHKGLFLPYGSGVVLIRDGRKLQCAYSVAGHCVQDALPHEVAAVSPANTSPELTRHFRGPRLWLPVRLAGVSAFRDALEEKLLLARYAYRQFGTIDHIELGPPPDLSSFTFRFLPQKGSADDINKHIVDLIREDGRIFLSSTRVANRFVLRMAILSIQTHKADVDLAVEVLREIASSVISYSREEVCL